MKRILTVVIVVSMVMALLMMLATGCKEQADSVTDDATVTEEEVAEETAEDMGEKVVKVMHIASPEADYVAEHLEEFEEMTGIKVEMDIVPRDDINVRYLRELIQGIGTYDVVGGMGSDNYTTYVYKGNYIPLGDYMTDEEVDNIYAKDIFIDPRTGKLSGITQYQNWEMLFYRKDLLNDPDEQAAFKEKYDRDLTVPKTMDELLEVAEFFHRPPEMYGYFVGAVPWSIFGDFACAIIGEGVNISDEEGNLTLTNEGVVNAMDYVAKLAQFGPPGWETQSFFDADQLMQEGKLFMYQNWFYIWQQYSTEFTDMIGVAPPTGNVQPGVFLSGFLTLVPANAPNPELGIEFLKWFGSYDFQKQQTIATGNLPNRTDVLEDSEVVESIASFDQYKACVPYTGILKTTWGNELQTGLQEAFFRIVNGEVDAAGAMDWLQNEKYADRKAIE